MKVVGVIAEFNPFHTGHSYFLKQAKEETGADCLIVVMSGDFVQRGEPAVMDKYARTRTALQNGADLLFELPMLYATASAEFFAGAGVSMLQQTGLVKAICFGCEDPDFPFEQIARLLLEEPDSYRDTLACALKEGRSFPEARAIAILQSFSGSGQTSDALLLKLEEGLKQPNNILGIEYAKAALPLGIGLHPLQRKGNSYHDLSPLGENLSASGLRSLLKEEGLDRLPEKDKLFYSDLAEYGKQKKYLFPEDLSALIYHALLQKRSEGYSEFADCDLDLSNRIKKLLPQYKDFPSFCQLLTSKNYTGTRIKRVLLHILFDIKDQPRQPKYLRLLGFRKEASPVLSAIKDAGQIPILSKPANASDLLDSEAMKEFELDLLAADLYEQLASDSHRPDITCSPIVLS